ncbi:UPF0147 family protein [Candidatus Woesearchaeota archaeon]|nr:UPF0147 family protein [Candidatus Woesearchaeota archaeon]MBW3021446.1 UPF0147 family protein [Candidatus Woesearchaeota archaeon]
MTELNDVFEVLAELLDDSTVPKNVKNKVQDIIDALKEDTELSIRINKALHILDEISDDTNLQSYTRTQIWNVVSLLENIQ